MYKCLFLSSKWTNTDVFEPVSGGLGGTVGGLCLPWGFHAVQTSTLGMSHNQTLWLLPNWPAGLPLAHLRASCLPETVTDCLPGCGADAVTRSAHTPPLCRHHKNNWGLAAQWSQFGHREWHVGERCCVRDRVPFPGRVVALRESLPGNSEGLWGFLRLHPCTANVMTLTSYQQKKKTKVYFVQAMSRKVNIR